MSKLKTIILICFVIINTSAYALMPPTVSKSGRWVSLSSSLVVDAIIDDKAVKQKKSVFLSLFGKKK